MAELPPESTPETPQQTAPPDGWELACSGILRSEFGRRPSRALHKAMMQLSAEQAWLEGRAEVKRESWWQRICGAWDEGPGFAFAVSAVVILILAVAGWMFFPGIHKSNGAVAESGSVCRIVDALNPRWAAHSAQLKIGNRLPATGVRLESGVVELAFASGARAAIEGPVELKSIDRNSVELLQGKLSAEVPKPAIGFTVRTPNASVTDLGTRFGIDAKSKTSSEVDVFEGKVHVAQGKSSAEANSGWDLTRNMAMILDERGGVTATAASEASFPQPGHAVMIRPANCGFDSQNAAKVGGFPSTFGVWSGPAFALTGPVADVRPVQGPGMLRFLAPPRQGGKVSDSVVWQLIDLSPAKDFMAAYGRVDLKAWVQFNRTQGDSHSASKFRLSIGAFRGPPSQAAALWATRSQTAVAFAEKELNADSDPRTWERVDLATTVSVDADFAVVEIRAIAPAETPAGVDPFPGNFADLIDAKVCLPLRAGNPTSSR